MNANKIQEIKDAIATGKGSPETVEWMDIAEELVEEVERLKGEVTRYPYEHKSWWELTVTHNLRDGNFFIQHDYKIDAERDYEIFKKAGFRVILRKVTSKTWCVRTAEEIEACWD